jgi:hypothetical protein
MGLQKNYKHRIIRARFGVSHRGPGGKDIEIESPNFGGTTLKRKYIWGY